MWNWRHHKTAAIAAFVFALWATTVFAADPTKIIVFPLDAVLTEEPLDWLREGIAISLSDQLGSHSLKAIGRNERIQLVENVDLPPGAGLSRGSMIRVAQRAAADLLVMGEFSGTERNLKVALRVLDLRTLKLSGAITANGPVSAMPQMENELAWLILSNAGIEKAEARADFQQRMRKVPNTAYEYFIRSLTSPNQKTQIQLLKNAVTAYRDFPEAQFQLGRIFFNNDDCENAIPHLALGRVEGRSNLESEFMQGTCLLQKDQSAQGIRALSQVLSEARFFEALNNLGVAYLRSGDTALALNMLSEAKSLAPADATVLVNLAVARHLQGNDLAARGIAEEGIKFHPKNGMLQFLLSVFLKRQGESEKALAAANKAKSLGVNVDKLLSDDHRAWSRVILSWEH